MTASKLALLDHFADLPDPRIDRTKLPPLADLLVLALCAVLGGAESWPDSEAFGHAKRDFFKRFLALPHGIPSHDTFRRVLAALNPAKCAAGFSSWMAALCDACGRVPIAIDGKALRRSPTATASGCLPLVSAWATANHLSLGQQEVEEGSKEITAIAELLRVLDLKGALVSIDAAGGQVEIAQQIRAQGGDYLLAVKGNQPALHEACERLRLETLETDCAGLRHDLSARSEDGHGRHEERYVTGLEDPVGLPPAWVDVKALVAVRRERPVKDKDSSERQLSLSSSRGRAKRRGGLVRGHGGIEQSLHWVRDVVFRADDHRTRGEGGANRGMLRRVAVSLLKRAPGKGSIPTKRLQAGWDNDFFLKVLGGITEN